MDDADTHGHEDSQAIIEVWAGEQRRAVAIRHAELERFGAKMLDDLDKIIRVVANGEIGRAAFEHGMVAGVAARRAANRLEVKP